MNTITASQGSELVQQINHHKERPKLLLCVRLCQTDSCFLSLLKTELVLRGQCVSTRGSVLRQGGESRHNTAAQRAVEDLHITGHGSPVSCSFVVLYIIDGGEAVEAPDGEELVVNLEHFQNPGTLNKMSYKLIYDTTICSVINLNIKQSGNKFVRHDDG